MVVIKRENDAQRRSVFVHTDTHTRLPLDCGYSGLHPAKPPQANALRSDMEIFYCALSGTYESTQIP